MGFPPFQADLIALNLLDYVDPDFIPGNAGGTSSNNPYSFCTEPVPMLNEIVVGSVLHDDLGTGNRVLTLNLEVEVWYPFYGVINPHSYALRAAPKLEGGTFSAPAVSMSCARSATGPAVSFSSAVSRDQEKPPPWLP